MTPQIATRSVNQFSSDCEGWGGYSPAWWSILLLFSILTFLGSAAAALTGDSLDGDSQESAVAALAPLALATATIQVPDGSQWSRTFPENTLLVGVVMNGVEVGTLEVVRDGERFFIPLEAFAELSGCDLEFDEAIVRLVTPLGAVEFSQEDLVEILGITYLTQDTIVTKLATPIVFDSEEFALVFDLPWWRETGVQPDIETVGIIPDATPPAASISALRSDIMYTENDGRDFFSNSTVINGRIAGGRWRIRYFDDFADTHNLREYAWLRTFGQNLVLVGQQRLNLHPVLQSFEFTGYQQAWTNQPLDLYYISPDPRELLPRRLQSVSTFRGSGPPGGYAALHVDGILLARQSIGLDGAYEFLDVPIQSRQLSTIEVYIFDRHNPAVPIAIHEKTQRNSEFMLGEGAVVHMGGLGLSGNLVQQHIDENFSSEFAGFYQWRYGATENFTLETAFQQDAGQSQLMGGFVARFVSDTVVSLGIGVSDEQAWGYEFSLEHYRGRRRVLGRSQIFQDDYRAKDTLETYDHYLEVGYSPGRNFDVSLIGRSRLAGDNETSFVLPAFSWWPTSSLSLRARPDTFGDYRFDLFYRLGPKARLTISHHERTIADMTYNLGRQVRLSAGVEHGSDLADRYFTTISWDGFGSRQPSITAGLSWSNNESGYRASGQITLLPGILGRLDYQDDPVTIDTQGRRARRLVIGVNIDMAFARGRVVPANTFSQRGDRGAIAGRIYVEAPKGFPDYRLDNLVILVDGRPRGRTLYGGSFFIGSLQPGIYRVRLDTENLPLELVQSDATIVAEVGAGAVTTIDFTVHPEFGIAGRLTDAVGRRIAGLSLVIIDSDGNRIGAAVSDRFGLYRIDGLAPGHYTLQVADGALPGQPEGPPSLALEITDDFLFGQDLVVPFEVPGPTD
ncbi:MAG: carboxypeptidase regulatory-like domain-containing protein [Thermoanaerobaculales bacterium]|nr:carboxypeptidase regulatory-like domain-containing protein [Thermoanaerobaculales bacterium]